MNDEGPGTKGNMTKEALEYQLEQAMSRYGSSLAFEETKGHSLSSFYREGDARCRLLESMSLEELLHLGSRGVSRFPTVGARKMKSLVEIFENLAGSVQSNSVKESRSQIAFEEKHKHESPHQGTTFLDIFLAAIEQDSDESQSLLQSIRTILREDSLEFTQSPLLQKVSEQLREIQKPEFQERYGNSCITDFWPEEQVRSSILEELSFAELAAQSPISLLSKKGVGIKKLQSLSLALDKVLGQQGPHNPHTIAYEVSSQSPSSHVNHQQHISAPHGVEGVSTSSSVISLFSSELHRILKEQELSAHLLREIETQVADPRLFLRSQALVRRMVERSSEEFLERWEHCLHELWKNRRDPGEENRK